MSDYNHTATIESAIQPTLSWGNFAFVAFAFVLLLGMTWLQKPSLFVWHQQTQTDSYATTDVPKYYAYVDTTPAEPLVAGASTNNVAEVINEDGSISPVDMGQVLGASTEDVTLSVDSIKVATIPDSAVVIQKYFIDTNNIESGPIDNSDFEAALSSNNQTLIDQQAQKLIGIRDALQKMSVPAGLAKLHKLKIVQYNAAIGVLQNFTQADNNPEQVGNYLQQFLKSQQDLDTEESNVAQKYNLDPVLVGAVETSTAATTGSSDTTSNAQ